MVEQIIDNLDDLFEAVSAQREIQKAVDSPPEHPLISISQPDQIVESSLASASVINKSTQTDVVSKNRENPMFDKLGGIVRQLHDSLKELGYDKSLSEMADEVSDSKGRLEYIASLTEKAANKVLNAIDVSMPEQDILVEKGKQIDSSISLFLNGKLSIDEFKSLIMHTQDFSRLVVTTAEQEKARLMDIMMAQDFQDITGQIIKKVVLITDKVEQELAQLLRDYSPSSVIKDKAVDLMAGPAVPANALVQDDVDSLLDDLGF